MGRHQHLNDSGLKSRKINRLLEEIPNFETTNSHNWICPKRKKTGETFIY